MKIPVYLGQLNREQQEAVLHTGNTLLILAGAGSGKTRVITSKIAYLIREKNYPPSSILAVTFTNKAAREMASRACAIDSRAAAVMIRTFHSFGAWFLRVYGEAGGLSHNFTIYDDAASQSLTASIMTNADKADVKFFARSISLAKDYFYTPQSPELALINHNPIFPNIYDEYEKALKKTGNADFGDLIKKPVEILRENPGVAEYIRNRFKVILVDEYQDANSAQFILLKELSGEGSYVCVVGDDDQSIYRFRGAELRNILNFQKEFGGADIIKLERNYRSKQEILSLAGSVIAHNKGRLGKTLTAERGSGKKPVLICVEDQEIEAEICANLIEESVKKESAQFSDWAILYRINAQSIGFENAFLRRAIPYRIVGGLKFYEREEIKDALALLAFLINPKDEVAFRRMVNKPARGVGKLAVQKIIAASGEAQNAETLWNLEIAAEKTKNALTAKARTGLQVFLSAIKNARSILYSGSSPGAAEDATDKTEGGEDAAKPEDANQAPKQTKKTPQEKDLVNGSGGLALAVAALVNDSGLSAHCYMRDGETYGQRFSNLQELINNALLFPCSRDGVISFLDQVELDKSLEGAEENSEESVNRVSLITLHNTKGLEFKRVIITACEQGLFPRNEKTGEELEEERRLFYVGATRAMDELYFTCASTRRVYGQIMHQTPSIFLTEADGDFLEKKGVSAASLFSKNAPAYAYTYLRNSRRGFSAIPTKLNSRIKTSSDGRWTVGDRIFNEDEGYGGVTDISEGEDGPVIKVCFDTGKERRFLSFVQSKSYLKITE
ncbi:MAG: ATP-dependent helicase [Spirochaetaceae bacterium]|jgi:DNA helicase-2/ATP-dependent DNA helicase PcrA|nr:ATP-dependent helicase [Spirochaetaceae bacterium]